MPKTLTVQEVAERLCVRSECVLRKIKEKELPASNIGTGKRPRYRVRVSALEKFLDERAVNGIEGG